MNVTINILELASELADKDLETHFGQNRWLESDDELRYTDEAQDLFDEYYDYYYQIIDELKLNNL
jgi:hypothetical protein